MEFDKLVDQILSESTSKAPKGDSYDSQNNWKPSGVDSSSDGSGGRYRRTRPNKPGRSKATHGGRGVSDEEKQDEFSFMSKPKRDTSTRDIERDIEKRSLGELIRIYGDDNVRRYFEMEYQDEMRRFEDNEEEDAEGKIDKDRMACNKPRRTSGGSKKFVVKACKDGKEKIVRYGDPNMKIKKSNPKRRKSFRARHKCDQKKDKFSAGYWSCKKW